MKTIRPEQLTDNPFRVMVSINKDNYSHHVISQTGIMNVNCLNVDAPFKVLKQFGFQSGRNADKFKGEKEILRSDNGLVFLSQYINAFFSLKVEDYKDLGTHGMFICTGEMLNKLFPKKEESEEQHEDEV